MAALRQGLEQVDDAELEAPLGDQLVAKLVELRDTLPKSNVGKILRKDLRAEEQRAQAAE